MNRVVIQAACKICESVRYLAKVYNWNLVDEVQIQDRLPSAFAPQRTTTYLKIWYK